MLALLFPHHAVNPFTWTLSIEIALAAAAAAGLVVFYFRVLRPLRRVRQLVRGLAEGRATGGYIATGAWGLRQIITDLETVDQALSSLRAQARSEGYGLKAILAGMAEGVIVTDAGRVIRMANGAFVRMFKPVGDPVGRRAFDVILHAGVHELMESAFTSGEASGEVSVQEHVGDSAGRSVFHLSVSSIRGEDGAPRGLVLVFHDITRIKQLEDVRREFVANVSHELRTPLAIFHGYLETLLAQPEMETDERERVLQVLSRHSNRLNALVDDLLTLSRIESGRIQLEKVTLQIVPFLERVAADWSGQFAKKECRLRLDLPAGAAGLLVEADPLRLEQVCFNLLDNALKYSESGKTVVLGIDPPAAAGATELGFYVRDNGIGIPSDKVGHIFKRFYRVDRARARDMGGTGLGLAIVKHIVQLHGGQVSAESELGRGTTIRFTLPVPAGEEDAGAEPDPEDAGVPMESPKSGHLRPSV